MSTEGGSAHAPQDNNDEPGTFKIKVLPAGSAPKSATYKPNVGGDLAPGQPNNVADTTYDDKPDVHKGLGSDAKTKDAEKEDKGHQVEIKGAAEREPETADSL